MSKNIHSLLIILCIVQASLQCYHTFKIIDIDTGRGIPMVNITTVDQIPHYSDSNGVVAYYEPDMMLNSTIDTYFYPIADGYTYPHKDWLGLSGLAVHVTCGGRTVIGMKRTNIAQRLYRVTGRGIYRDSFMTDEPVPGMSKEFVKKNMLLKQQVLGQDSVMTVNYKNKKYWFYGDTNRLSYPLGNFFVTGATTDITGWDIEIGIDLKYITNGENDTFVKPLAPDVPPPNGGPTWIHAPFSRDGTKDLYATYMRPIPDTRGFLKWNDDTGVFDFIRQLNDTNVWPTDGGHALLTDDYLMFGNPYPYVRTLPDSYIIPQHYQTYTCLKEGTGIPKDLSKVQLDRAFSGKLVYGWKQNTSPLTPFQMGELVSKKLITQEESMWLQLRSADETSELVMLNAGTVAFNQYRNRWIMIGEQVWGKQSFIGEIWYAEAVSPIGPWCFAVKVVSHNSRDFYNPAHHSSFDNGPNIYFEGTYVNTFDKAAPPTPYYDYNQQLYKLELNDTRLFEIPVLVWKRNGKHYVFDHVHLDNTTAEYEYAFFAYDRPCVNCTAVYQDDHGKLFTGAAEGRNLLCYAKKVFVCTSNECTQRRKEIITNDGNRIVVMKVPPIYTGEATPAHRPFLLILFSVIGLVLLITCITVIIVAILKRRRKKNEEDRALLVQ
jgi:hypothetical protein